MWKGLAKVCVAGAGRGRAASGMGWAWAKGRRLRRCLRCQPSRAALSGAAKDDSPHTPADTAAPGAATPPRTGASGPFERAALVRAGEKNGAAFSLQLATSAEAVRHPLFPARHQAVLASSLPPRPTPSSAAAHAGVLLLSGGEAGGGGSSSGARLCGTLREV